MRSTPLLKNYFYLPSPRLFEIREEGSGIFPEDIIRDKNEIFPVSCNPKSRVISVWSERRSLGETRLRCPPEMTNATAQLN